MQTIPSEEARLTAKQSQFAESELVEYGKIEEITQAASSGASDGSSYS
ncbi:hypothetical protein AB4Y89_08095 [Terriglobus sp. 2YAB30_2]